MIVLCTKTVTGLPLLALEVEGNVCEKEDGTNCVGRVGDEIRWWCVSWWNWWVVVAATLVEGCDKSGEKKEPSWSCCGCCCCCCW